VHRLTEFVLACTAVSVVDWCLSSSGKCCF